jgi:hypothetical protein
MRHRHRCQGTHKMQSAGSGSALRGARELRGVTGGDADANSLGAWRWRGLLRTRMHSARALRLRQARRAF